MAKTSADTNMKSLDGVIAAIATAVDDNGEPDCERSVALARFLLANGCDGLNVLGTTGEATSFSLDQRRRNCRRNRIDQPRRRARFCRRAGAAAVLLQGCCGRWPCRGDRSDPDGNR